MLPKKKYTAEHYSVLSIKEKINSSLKYFNGFSNILNGFASKFSFFLL